MCGIVGLVAKVPVNQLLFDALTVLQHRGQDAAGMITLDQGRFFMRKANGLVSDVFRMRHMKRLKGQIGIGHIRYPTAGSPSSAEAQPFYVNSPYGIALAHNGNLINTAELKKALFYSDLRHINTHSDSEVLLNILAHELSKASHQKSSLSAIFTAVTNVYKRCQGGYAVVSLINGHGILAFRDSNGIRPLVLGQRINNNGDYEYMVASESVALDVLGFTLLRDVNPGEAIYIELDGTLHTQQCVSHASLNPCMFEYVYLARPDSIMNNISVYQARLAIGRILANQLKPLHQKHHFDVIIPIPDTSRSIALEIAQKMNIPYREGFVKNRYIGRTFIMPGQAVRKKSVKQKLNAINSEFHNKNVLLVDDSIVRGTTSKQIVEMAREAGASKVFFCSAAPPVRFPNIYGIDMPTHDELVGHGRTIEEVCHFIGADGLFYQTLEDLNAALNSLAKKPIQFECSVFDGHYVVGDIDENYLRLMAHSRYESMTMSESFNTMECSAINDVNHHEDTIDLHNDASESQDET